MALAGLNHKLGWRGTTNTLLNFGEGKFPVDGKAGAVGYLVGQPGKGLRCMFHMMNEARIGVGTAATMLGMAGYHASLDYAKNRPQGRPGRPAPARTRPSRRCASSSTPTCERMLLAQKAYCEGALALELYCARLVDEQKTGDAQAADDARLLLEVLTPIAKSWPSEWCLEANSLAIQIHGGYGYTRDFPVEQYWRDNRLNMIHEGTHGIQAADLLGRKVLMEDGRGMQLLAARINATIERASRMPALAAHAKALAEALQSIGDATKAAWATGNPQRGAGQCRALHAGLRPHGAGLDLARRGAACARARRVEGAAGHRRAHWRDRLFLPLRIAQDRRLAPGGRTPRSDLRRIARGGFLMAANPMPGSRNWIWILIYGGLFMLVLGIATGRTDQTLGWAMAVPGAALAVVGVVLIYVRSRLKDSP